MKRPDQLTAAVTTALAMLSLPMLACCGEKPPKPVTAPLGSEVQPAPPFPWPKDATGELPEPCVKPEGRVRAGLAVDSDLWMTVTCEVGRLPPEKVDAFLADVRKLVDAIPFEYRKFPVNRLPARLTAQFSTEERTAWGSTVLVYADGPALDANPELRHFKDLGSGAIRGVVCAPWDKTRGHYEVTKHVAELHLEANALRPSGKAILVLADASQDPDFFDWDTPAAHGQTPTGTNSMPTVPASLGQTAWVTWIDAYVDRAGADCTAAAAAAEGSAGRTEKTRTALYFLGYAVHAVEDVASHRGRTNPEHSYNAYAGNNPDEAPSSIKLAEDMAGTFLVKTLRGRLAHCAPLFKSYEGAQVQHHEKGPLLAKSLQLTPWKLIAYKASALAFAPLNSDPQARVRWFGGDAPPASCSQDPACAALLAKVAR